VKGTDYVVSRCTLFIQSLIYNSTFSVRFPWNGIWR